VYVYREGLVRFATEKYNQSNKEEGSVYAHLTNYSINKKNENYVQNDDAGDDDSGFKWSFSAM
jgi:tubulin polyglutamylase TTLL4